MKTILFVYPTLFHPRVGGIERVTDLLTKEFLKLSYRVLYLHNIHNLGLLDYDYPAPIYYFPKADYRDVDNIAFYHDFLKEHEVDVVINQCGNFGDSHLYLNIGNNIGVKTLSVLHSNPLINYDHLPSEVLVLKEKSLIGVLKLCGRFFLYPKIKREYLKRRCEHFEYLQKSTDRICLLSESFTNELSSCVHTLNKDIISSIPNPNSYDICSYEKKKQLLYVGRLDKGQKRPDRLLSIWKKLYRDFLDWNLVIVGDGPERKSLERKASKLERVSILGFKDPLPYYQESSIFCLVSNFEGFGLVLTEAQSCGTIPLAFDSYASVRDIIKDGETGFLIRPFSLKDYESQLRLLMSDNNLRNEMSKNCLLSVQRFSLANIVKQWNDLIQSL